MTSDRCGLASFFVLALAACATTQPAPEGTWERIAADRLAATSPEQRSIVRERLVAEGYATPELPLGRDPLVVPTARYIADHPESGWTRLRTPLRAGRLVSGSEYFVVVDEPLLLDEQEGSSSEVRRGPGHPGAPGEGRTTLPAEEDEVAPLEGEDATVPPVPRAPLPEVDDTASPVEERGPSSAPSSPPPPATEPLPPVDEPPPVEVVVPREPVTPDPEARLDGVYAVQSVHCEPPHEARVTLLRGKPTADDLALEVIERTAVWYDHQRDGISAGDWFCVEPHRFCYGVITFEVWRGSERIGDVFAPSLGAISEDASERALIELTRSAVDATCSFDF